MGLELTTPGSKMASSTNQASYLPLPAVYLNTYIPPTNQRASGKFCFLGICRGTNFCANQKKKSLLGRYKLAGKGLGELTDASP